MRDLMLDVDQAGELKAAFRRGDWTNADIKRACEGDLMARFRDVVRGYAQITITQHVVDCDAMPFVPEGWKVEEHKKAGHYNHFELYVPKITLHLSPNQMNGKVIGNDLLKELASEPVLNANVLDYLLAHPELIPEDWKRDEKGNMRHIFFWGTIYRGPLGRLFVRCLFFVDCSWQSGSDWLGINWDDQAPAAALTA